MIVLFTDFGWEGPYIGQMQASIHAIAPQAAVVNLFADVPAHNPRAAAYLLAAYAPAFPAGSVFVCVVDPGVGTAQHQPGVVRCDGRDYVGPDNGQFEMIRRRGKKVENYHILWRPERLSHSFHGRDLYAPVAAMLAPGQPVDLKATAGLRFPDWPDDLAEIIYLDHFGNAMTGLQASTMPAGAALRVKGRSLPRLKTFAEAGLGEGFWYENANGLVEIAVNQGRADHVYDLSVGDAVKVEAS
ncbi:MAG TPA: SAM-dependent chlorinase/fluorinase [Gammaproteobacteria bacterium]|nr:SAM-dependent chlorinase/fluorinase [Gammaproteobacteria bacterium]